MFNTANIALLIPSVGIIFGTGMITAITVSIIRAVSRPKKGGQTALPAGMPTGMPARLKKLEERVTAQGAEIRKLQEESAFLVKLLEREREAE
jgi:hypothetical protein